MGRPRKCKRRKVEHCHEIQTNIGQVVALLGRFLFVTRSVYSFQLLASIGEMLEENSNLICGCVAQVRNKGDKLCLWTGNGEDKEGNVAIGFEKSVSGKC